MWNFGAEDLIFLKNWGVPFLKFVKRIGQFQNW